MATFNSTTFGAISGRHGSAVATTTKDGKSILKIFRAPANPNSEKQQAQRTKFGFVNKELSCMRNLFKVTFRNTNGMQQGVSLAMRNAIIGESPDYEIDYSLITISTGSVNTTGRVSATKTSDTKIKMEWDTTVGTNSSDNDGVNFVFLNQLEKMSILKQNHLLRSAGEAEIELPALWIGAEVHCWIYFSSLNDTLNSASQYIGLVQL